MHAFGYFDCVGFEFLKSINTYSFGQGRETPLVESVSAIEMPKYYRRNADEMLNTICQKQMPKTKC